MYDCWEAGGRVPTTGALGDAGAVTWEQSGEAIFKSLIPDHEIAALVAPGLPASREPRKSLYIALAITRIS